MVKDLDRSVVDHMKWHSYIVGENMIQTICSYTHTHRHTCTPYSPTQTIVRTSSESCQSLCSCEESEPLTKQSVWGLIFKMAGQKRGPRMGGQCVRSNENILVSKAQSIYWKNLMKPWESDKWNTGRHKIICLFSINLSFLLGCDSSVSLLLCLLRMVRSILYSWEDVKGYK